jgi:hypothetical protein
MAWKRTKRNHRMSLLAPVPDLHFDAEAHRYKYKDTWLPTSVTQVVSDLNDVARKRIEETKHIWAPRGNTVHACLEAHLLGEAACDFGEYGDWVKPLLSNWLWDDAEILAVEYRLVEPRKLVAGSFDFLLRTAKGSIVLGDLKTVGSAPAAKSRKTADAQLGAYAMMLEYHHPHLIIDKCVTVIAGPGVCEVKSSDPDFCSLAWLNAWDKYQVQQELLYGF